MFLLLFNLKRIARLFTSGVEISASFLASQALKQDWRAATRSLSCSSWSVSGSDNKERETFTTSFPAEFVFWVLSCGESQKCCTNADNELALCCRARWASCSGCSLSPLRSG